MPYDFFNQKTEIGCWSFRNKKSRIANLETRITNPKNKNQNLGIINWKSDKRNQESEIGNLEITNRENEKCRNYKSTLDCWNQGIPNPETRNHKSAIKNQKSENRNQITEIKNQKTDIRQQKSKKVKIKKSGIVRKTEIWNLK